MSYFVEIHIGDPSHDGHNQSEKFFIESNKTNKEILDLTEKAKEIGFDFSKICSEYEDSCIPEHIWEKAYELNIEIPCENDEYQMRDLDDLTHKVSPSEFFQFWMNTLQHIDPSFEWSFVKTLKISNYFAYGCFNEY